MLADAVTTGEPTEAELLGWMSSMSNWGRWGSDDQLGALNLLTPDKVRAAAALVGEGRSVSLAPSSSSPPSRAAARPAYLRCTSCSAAAMATPARAATRPTTGRRSRCTATT